MIVVYLDEIAMTTVMETVMSRREVVNKTIIWIAVDHTGQISSVLKSEVILHV